MLGPAGTGHGWSAQPGVRALPWAAGRRAGRELVGDTQGTDGSWCPDKPLWTSLPLSVSLCGKSVSLRAGEKWSWLPELVQSHLLSFVVNVGDSDAKKGNI